MPSNTKQEVKETTPETEMSRVSILNRAIAQIKDKNFDINELVKDTSVSEQFFFFGLVVSFFLLIFGPLLKKVIAILFTVGFRCMGVIIKEFWIVVKSVFVATVILVILMSLIYSTALITLIVKSK